MGRVGACEKGVCAVVVVLGDLAFLVGGVTLENFCTDSIFLYSEQWCILVFSHLRGSGSALSLWFWYCQVFCYCEFPSRAFFWALS